MKINLKDEDLDDLQEFVKKSDELAKFSMAAANATGYKKDKFNFSYYTLVLIKIKKILEGIKDDR